MKENELSVVSTMNEGDKLRLVLSDGSSAFIPFTSMPVATMQGNGLMSAENALRENNRFFLYFQKIGDKGYLCKTNISKSFTSMFILRVTVNSYSTDMSPSLIIVQGYMYTSGLMSVSSSILGTSMPIYLLEIDNVLYFYFPGHCSFMTYYVEFLCNISEGYIVDKSIREKPQNATKEFVIK